MESAVSDKPLTTGKRREPYEQKRERAIRAAATVFAEKGYHGATTKDIAERLGIRQGSLYYYFRSKEEALEEVCILALRDYVGRMENITHSNKTFADKILDVVHSHLNSYRDDNEALKVHNDQRLYLPEERRERIKRDGSHYRKMLEDLFRAEIAKGAIPQNIDAQFAAQSVIGLCNSWGALLVRDDDIDMERLAERCSDLILNGCCYRPDHTFQSQP
ncbi:MAG: hypothetical protein CMK32_04515 [Porticoccaceae bacterium]|nr:hypothetical protein [Porticoccaceae bacterium]